MNTKLFAVFLGAAVVLTGCYSTPDGKKHAGVPIIKDQIEGRYERSADQVLEAAKEVIKFNGTLVSESTLHGGTNLVRSLEGKVNQRSVWVRVEQLDPKVTSVVVQVRTKGGGRDFELNHELEKQIALKLAR